MRRRWKPEINHNLEFELDLAPLLAVMVKLVPVLLISSAFVQVMIIETDLPQAVKEAMQKPEDPKQPKANIYVDVSHQSGIKITVQKGTNQEIETVAPAKDGSIDYLALHNILVKVKTKNPEVFRLALAPAPDVTYQEITKLMDMARQAQDKQVRFPVFDSKQNKEIETNFMFPEVVFSNVMEG